MTDAERQLQRELARMRRASFGVGADGEPDMSRYMRASADVAADNQQYVQHGRHGHHHHDHAEHFNWRTAGLVAGVSLSAAALIAAPTVLPWFGVGEGLEDIMFGPFGICNFPEAKGLAGMAAGLLSHVPIIGDTLAQGGFMNSILGAGMAGAGSWLWMLNGEDDNALFWRRVVASALIVAAVVVIAPSVLPAITTGLTFLTLLAERGTLLNDIEGFFNVTFNTPAIREALVETIGTVPNHASSFGLAGLGVAAAHLIGCGIAIAAPGLAASAGAAAGQQQVVAPVRDSQLHALRERTVLLPDAHGVSG